MKFGTEQRVGATPPESTQPPAWHAMTPDSILGILGSRQDGLTLPEVTQRREEYGANVLPKAAGDSPWLMLWRQINTPIGWLLVGAGSLALILQKTTDAIVVFGALVVNAIIGFFRNTAPERPLKRFPPWFPRWPMHVAGAFL